MVRFAVIGTNFITDRFLEAAITHDEFELVAVYSRSMAKAEEYAQQYQASLCFDALDQLAECTEVDAVYIASPTSLHFSQTMMMLNHKKHVLCEKPLCSSESEAKLMFQVAKDNGVILMEAMRPAHDVGVQAICDNLSKLGPIRGALLQYCQYSSRYDKFKDGIIENAFNPKFSNGAIMDIGVYIIYLMIRLFGEPKEITATGITLHNGINAHGTIVANYEQMQAILTYSKIVDAHMPGEIQGEKGTMTIWNCVTPERAVITYRDGTTEEIAINRNNDNNMIYELEDFIAGINERKDLACYEAASRLEMSIIQEARKQMGIVFPADSMEQLI